MASWGESVCDCGGVCVFVCPCVAAGGDGCMCIAVGEVSVCECLRGGEVCEGGCRG